MTTSPTGDLLPASESRQWFVRRDEVVTGPVPPDALRVLAEQADIQADTPVSKDGRTWIPAAALPELKMDWVACLDDGRTHGPFNMLAASHLARQGIIGKDTAIRPRSDVGATPRVGPRPGDPPLRAPLPPPPTVAADAVTPDLYQVIAMLASECHAKACALQTALQHAERTIRELTDKLNTERKTAFQRLLQESIFRCAGIWRE